MRIFTTLGLTLLSALIVFAYAQQIPQFSQYSFNALHINPAYAGYKIEPFVQATYRSQFMSFPGAPRTFSITGDMASNDESMGFGFSLLSDRLGASDVQSILLTYSYKVQLGRDSFLALGLSAGTSEYSIDGTRLLPDDPSDGTIPMERLNLFTPNLNTGVFFHSERFFSGLSMYNLVGKRFLQNEDLSLATHDIHYFFQVGGILPVSDQTLFKPSILIREDFSAPTSFDLNAMFLFNDTVWLGTSYRSSAGSATSRNALAFLFDFFVTDQFRFGYAYDFNLSPTSNFRNNSHEFSLGYYLGEKLLNSRHSYKF